VPDRVPDLDRRAAERTVGDAHQPRVAVDQHAPVAVLEPAEPVDVEDVLRHEAMEEAERRQRHVAVSGQVHAQLRAQVEQFAVVDGVHRRCRHFRYDRLHVPGQHASIPL